MENNYPKILYKSQVREYKGYLKSFYDLPEDIQENFKKIKIYLEKYFDKKIPVFVWGSYLRGTWGETSDYDVIILEPVTDKTLIPNIRKELNIKVDIFTNDGKENVIEIP